MLMENSETAGHHNNSPTGLFVYLSGQWLNPLVAEHVSWVQLLDRALVTSNVWCKGLSVYVNLQIYPSETTYPVITHHNLGNQMPDVPL